MQKLNSDAKIIPVSDARLLGRVLDLNPGEFERLLSGTELTEAELQNEAALLSTSQQIQIIRNAFELSGDPALGLRVGHWLTPSTHSYLGLLARSSPDVKTAVELFAEYLPSRLPFLEITTRQNECWLECTLAMTANADDIPAQWVVEPTFLALQALIEFILRCRLVEGRLQFAFPEPDYVSQYEVDFSSSLEFSAASNVFSVPLNVCKMENTSENSQIYMFLLEQYKEMRVALERQSGHTVQSVERVLLSNPPGTLNIDDVASTLCVSRSTLIRRLDEEGATFRGLKESQLSALAAKYLEDTDFSTSSIADLLNYHDSASFRRACKRWFNKTPSAYRSGIQKSR